MITLGQESWNNLAGQFGLKFFMIAEPEKLCRVPKATGSWWDISLI